MHHTDSQSKNEEPEVHKIDGVPPRFVGDDLKTIREQRGLIPIPPRVSYRERQREAIGATQELLHGTIGNLALLAGVIAAVTGAIIVLRIAYIIITWLL